MLVVFDYLSLESISFAEFMYNFSLNKPSSKLHGSHGSHLHFVNFTIVILYSFNINFVVYCEAF